MKRYEELTKEQIANILNSDLKETYMYLGKIITCYHDTTLTLCNLYSIVGDNELFDNEDECKAKIKSMFLQETQECRKNRNRKDFYAIGHLDPNTNKVYYEGGLQGLGQSMGYTATNLENAWWFESLDELCAFLKKYCYTDGSIIVEVPRYKLYHEITGHWLV